MTNQAVERLLIHNESYHQDLRWVEEINVSLLRRVAALKYSQDNPIVVLDSPEPVPVPPPGRLGPGSMLIPIDDIDDDQNQAIAEDQAERGRVIGDEG